jgi:putative sigma-54 modulation protein
MVVTMELQIRSNGTKITDGMREFIDRRMAKLDRLAEHVTEANLELRTEETRTGQEITTAQLTLHTGRHVLRAEERDAEPAKAVDAAIDKLIRQVRKFNDKKVSRRKRGAQAAPLLVDDMLPPDFPASEPAGSLFDGEDDEDGPVLVRTKRFPMKPMDVDEAIDQMELVGHDFFLFHNVDGDQLNVLYRRRDGSFGLLAPQ